MAWKVSADPQRFDEAEAWFDSKFPVTAELKEQLGAYAGSRAWTVAGVAQLDVVLQVFESIRGAIETGQSLDEWKRDIRDKLEQSWGRPDSARLETIFRNSVQSSYNAGRYHQMMDPAVLQVRPFGLVDAIMDGRTSLYCRELNGTIRPLSDVWWMTHWFPAHHRCRTSVRNLTEAQAKRRGITETPPDTEPSDGFGAAPTADEWKPDPNKYPPELWRIFEDKQVGRRK